MAALERTMKIQEVILRALAKKIIPWQAAELIGITDRQMRRMAWRYFPLANLPQRECFDGGQPVEGRW
jgi:YD repeat-containing protein